MVAVVWLDAGLPGGLVLGLLGLLIGSFLNVVIYRLPKMMERQWAAECAELNGNAVGPTAAQPAAFNLLTPRSCCQQCSRQIRWYENVPVASYLALGGKCAGCKTRIGLRYPLVELLTGMLFAWCGWKWGVSPVGLAWCAFCAAIVALAFIDWDTTLLPDGITLPLLWGGLIACALRITPLPLSTALWGAVAGYLSLWLVYWAFKLATGKEGMGYGDFKLFAALGAWFGWAALIPIILMASVIGALVGIALKLGPGLREGGYVPFGPFLAGAGLTAMVFSPEAMLRAVGL